jgi:anti-sigma factor ChrR (cupin superfamily)
MRLVARDTEPCEQIELVSVYALNALSVGEVPAVEAHISSCSRCLQELDELRPIVDAFVAWPTDVLRPAASLEVRLAHRIAAETGGEPMLPGQRQWIEPEWEQVAPGISCKLLATDAQKHCVSMLVRLVPGGEYPPHTHAGVEELHLLDGELYIDDRKLCPGDYNRAEPGTGDKRVWSETGCTCVLVTSTRDQLLTADAPSTAADTPLAKFEVLPEGKAWLAKHPLGFTLKFSTRNAAVDYAREVAMNTKGSELVVYGSSGAVESRERFDSEK